MPEFIKPLPVSPVQATQGQPLVMEVEFDGVPSPDVVWYRNGRPAVSSPEWTVSAKLLIVMFDKLNFNLCFICSFVGIELRLDSHEGTSFDAGMPRSVAWRRRRVDRCSNEPGGTSNHAD